MNKNREIKLKELSDTRYSRILTYPTSDPGQADARIKELAAIGVTAICFNGATLIDGIPILGKGCVGIVTQAIIDGALVALKIRRLDADRPSMSEEARLLRLANAVNVGPRLITATRNLIAMELFDGAPLFKWAEASSHTERDLKQVMAGLLDACFRLDLVGLDHGELSHAPKNVLVGDERQTCIVDFESASMVRRVANVTSLLQYFMFGRISRSLQTSRIFHEKRKIINALSRYKAEGSIENYRDILQTIHL
ncbi:MAG: serine/threonine protein kinase [Candidatus Bathyarchaeia archaeon]